MKILAVVVIVTAFWLVLGAVLGGCGHRRTSTACSGGQAWMWECLGPRAALVGRPGTLPDSHPLAPLDRSVSHPV
jgi:hypothetical protein